MPPPKRSGDFAQYSKFLDGSSTSQSKKPRFDARNPSILVADEEDVDEDSILDLDVIGKSKRNQTKRNAVEVDGYDSDSDPDNFDARALAKAKRERAGNAASKDEDEDDMFADLEQPDGDDDEELAREGKGKKEVRFMENHEIEGQEEDSKGGGHVAADFTGNGEQSVESSSESGDDEERDRLDSDVDEELGAGSKKKHAPRLDAFNMKQEGEEGRFDEAGNYIRKQADPEAKYDSWLEGVSKKEMRKAREAREKRLEEQRQRALADDAISTADSLTTLIKHLERSETPTEALMRLDRMKPKKEKKKPWIKNKRKDEMLIDQPGGKPEEVEAEKLRREAIDSITEAATRLLNQGDTDIYDSERELLMRQYKRETGEDFVDASPQVGADDADEQIQNGSGTAEPKQWEYRWTDGRDDMQVNGPFDGPMMAEWHGEGYFDDNIEYREKGSSEWSRNVDFV